MDREERREKFREQMENIEGFSEYIRLFKLLPRPIRLVGYLGIIVTLPFYLGLTPKLAQDLFTEPMENIEIYLGWRLPHQWHGRYSAGVIKEFIPARWDGASEETLGPENSMLVLPDQALFYQLTSPVFSLYDFYVKFDVEIQKDQHELQWALRANRDDDTYYGFRLQWEGEQEYWRFDGTTNYGSEFSEALFINEPILEVNPLKEGDKLSVLLYAQGCIFEYRFLVDRNLENMDFEDFEDFENSGEGSTLTAIAFAERPCFEHGDFGLLSRGPTSATRLQSMEICSQEDEEIMEVFCGDFKSYFRPEPFEVTEE